MKTLSIQESLNAAKANPNGAFATQLRSMIESGQLDEAAKKQGVDLTKYGRPAPQTTAVERVKTELGKRSEKIADIYTNINKDTKVGKASLDIANELIGAPIAAAYEALPQGVQNVAEKAIAPVGKGINLLSDLIGSNPQLQKFVMENPDKAKQLEDVFGNIATGSEIIGNAVALGSAPGVAQKAATTATKAATATAGAAADTATNLATSAVGTVKSIAPKTKKAFINFVSPSIDDTTKTVLKGIKQDKFDEVVSAAEKAAMDPSSPSVFEKVSESMTKAAEQIDSQVKSLSQQKKTIINKAKVGLEPFDAPTRTAILDINRALPESAVAKDFIAKLKSVTNKVEADKVIDEMQNKLYTGNRDLTIPVGSNEDRILKGIIGKYNSELKASLPKSYSTINDKIATRLDTLDTLNRSLGETIDGVATRGAGLVKQYFSPAGTKTKELFKYIKQNTGIDLAQDAILAKYVGEAFGDPKIRSLLTGIPTTKSGVLDTVTEFVLEKTGANSALNEAVKKGKLSKARNLTSKNK